MRKIRLAELAHGRSGDKGDVCNIGLVAYDDEKYEIMKRYVTAERIKEYFGDLITGPVYRYELPNIRALNFVCHGALDGGATQSLRTDHLGKAMYAMALRMEIEVDDEQA